MTTPRRPTTWVAGCLTAAALLVTSGQTPTQAGVDEGRCADRAPIRASALNRDGSMAGCSLVGRVVYAGRVSVVVPPPGMTVSGEGVGRHGAVPGLRVTNTGTGVRAVVGRAASGERVAHRGASAPACQDRTFHLEPGADPWVTSLRYSINLSKAPADAHRKTLVDQIKAANANVRKGRNTCGKPHLATPGAHYLGRSGVRPHITSSSSFVSCGTYDKKNVVAFGNLPAGLLGWTCNWSSGSTHLSAADILMDNGASMATRLPTNCLDIWDFEGVVTHEMGHVYGMAHTGSGSGHDNLTMQHELTPCSTYARTLGLGDWLGMKKMYGVR
ncbi:hypothetical protein [Nocardioides cynanchi]|uniref:hypothetical protein n=1 Tax=Nocardioides cynanchi TaxID=2558918 RepID=UPI001781E64C|nr:hypothetical protein [Nocardioides cynanchi]